MSTIALNNLWIYIQSMMLSDRNKQWLADRLIESKTDKVKTAQAAQEKYVRESLTRAINEVREARRTGKKLQSAQSLLEEMTS